MGLIKEPKGVDLLVGPSDLSEKDRKMISEIIADYKLTGKVPTKKAHPISVRRKSSRVQKKKVTV